MAPWMEETRHQEELMRRIPREIGVSTETYHIYFLVRTLGNEEGIEASTACHFVWDGFRYHFFRIDVWCNPLCYGNDVSITALDGEARASFQQKTKRLNGGNIALEAAGDTPPAWIGQLKADHQKYLEQLARSWLTSKVVNGRIVDDPDRKLLLELWREQNFSEEEKRNYEESKNSFRNFLTDDEPECLSFGITPRSPSPEEFDRFIESLNALPVRRLDWQILPPGIDLVARITGRRRQRIIGNEEETPRQRERVERVSFLRSLNPFHVWEGRVLETSGSVYYAYEFEKVVVAECTEYGNALYWVVKDADDSEPPAWQIILGQTKDVAVSMGAKRLTHHERARPWKDRLKAIVA